MDLIIFTFFQSGYYMPNVEVVRERYRVIHPKLRDLSSHGYYIWRQCHLMDTYMLERIGAHDPIGKYCSVKNICTLCT